MRTISMLAFGFATLTPAASQAQTMMQRLACTGDALRLCSAYVPHHKLVANCMELKHDQLSRRCMVVFDAGMRALQGQDR